MHGPEFKALRKRLGFSYEDAAATFGVARPTIYHWEQRGTPSKGAARNHVERILAKMVNIVPTDKEKKFVKVVLERTMKVPPHLLEKPPKERSGG